MKNRVDLALLRNSRVRGESPFALSRYATHMMAAVPRAEKRFISATQMWISAVCRSGFLAEMRKITPRNGLSYDFPWLPCDKGAAARHPKYAGQRRGTDREWVGRVAGRAVV